MTVTLSLPCHYQCMTQCSRVSSGALVGPSACSGCHTRGSLPAPAGGRPLAAQLPSLSYNMGAVGAVGAVEQWLHVGLFWVCLPPV